jgi:hypothetical protein
MNIVLTPFLAGWIVMACGVAALAIYRKTISSHEDDTLHVSAASNINVSQQTDVAHRLDVIDRWGKLMTIIAAAYGLALAALYTYQMWVEGSRTMWKG